MIGDFGGDFNVTSDTPYASGRVPNETLIKNCSTLVYVIDAQEEDYEDALPKLVETISTAHRLNPQVLFSINNKVIILLRYFTR